MHKQYQSLSLQKIASYPSWVEHEFHWKCLFFKDREADLWRTERVKS